MVKTLNPEWRLEYLSVIGWIYLCTSFIQLDWNPLDWSQGGRIGAVGFAVIFLLLTIGMNRERPSEKVTGLCPGGCGKPPHWCRCDGGHRGMSVSATTGEGE